MDIPIMLKLFPTIYTQPKKQFPKHVLMSLIIPTAMIMEFYYTQSYTKFHPGINYMFHHSHHSR